MTTDMSTPSKKRKSAEEDDELTDSSTAKKAKLASAAPQTASKVAMKSKSHDDKEIEGNEQVDEFPNGYFYCHQCCRKRDPSGMYLWLGALKQDRSWLCYSWYTVHLEANKTTLEERA